VDDLEAEKAEAEGKNWKTDLSGGIQRVVMKVHGCHFGATPRRAPWCGIFPTACPCTVSAVFAASGPGREVSDPRRQKAFWRLPTLFKSVQEKNKYIPRIFR
jgi:formate dehydrogenase major subunit